MHLQVRLEHSARVSLVGSDSTVCNFAGKPKTLQTLKRLSVALEHLRKLIRHNTGVQVNLQPVHHTHAVDVACSLPDVLSDVEPGGLTGQVQVIVSVCIQPAESHLLLDIASQHGV